MWSVEVIEQDEYGVNAEWLERFQPHADGFTLVEVFKFAEEHGAERLEVDGGKEVFRLYIKKGL